MREFDIAQLRHAYAHFQDDRKGAGLAVLSSVIQRAERKTEKQL